MVAISRCNMLQTNFSSAFCLLKEDNISANSLSPAVKTPTGQICCLRIIKCHETKGVGDADSA